MPSSSIPETADPETPASVRSGTATTREWLAGYDPPLLETLAERVTRFSKPRGKKAAAADERVLKALGSKAAIPKLVKALGPNERQVLAVFRRLPSMRLRWDHAARLLTALGIEEAPNAITSLLGDGLLVMATGFVDRKLKSFRIFPDTPTQALPTVALTPDLREPIWQVELAGLEDLLEGPQGATDTPLGAKWRHSDGWELPLRLAALWRLAWVGPFKRTQQGKLFKRDEERLEKDAALGAPMLDQPAPLHEVGRWALSVASAQGWTDEDERPPALETVWPASLDDLLLACATDTVALTSWNELGPETPVGSFPEEVPSARVLLLLWLSTAGPDESWSVADLAKRLLTAHPPWNGVGELVGPFRHAADRERLAHAWTQATLLGPLYQLGLLEVAPDPEADGDTWRVRLTPLGRVLCGQGDELPPRPEFPQTLMVQPNHEVIVYRQGMTVGLLAKLVRFAVPASLGAAITFGVNADSVYHGLEAGLEYDEILELLEKHSGPPVPSGVADSIRTWTHKRDRLSVYASAALLEFDAPTDLEACLERGVEGVALTDRLLLVTGDLPAAYKHLRITASRDYRGSSDRCVEVDTDGVTLRVDPSKSDLMLEAELGRFADPVPNLDTPTRRAYRLTSNSLARGLSQGVGITTLDEWFEQRTGSPLSASVRLLLRSVDGLKLSLERHWVLHVDSPVIADGLMQHPRTAPFFGERVGPTALLVPEHLREDLVRELTQLGIDLPGEAETDDDAG